MKPQLNKLINWTDYALSKNPTTDLDIKLPANDLQIIDKNDLNKNQEILKVSKIVEPKVNLDINSNVTYKGPITIPHDDINFNNLKIEDGDKLKITNDLNQLKKIKAGKDLEVKNLQELDQVFGSNAFNTPAGLSIQSAQFAFTDDHIANKKFKSKKEYIEYALKHASKTLEKNRGTLNQSNKNKDLDYNAIMQKYPLFNKETIDMIHQQVFDPSRNKYSVSFETALANYHQFFEIMGHIENNGKVTGGNKTTSARGLYQFVNASENTAYNKANRYYKKIFSRVNYDDDINKKDVRIDKYGAEEQTAMAYAYLSTINNKTAKELWARVMAGDITAEEAYYSLYHHTNIKDEATQQRVAKIFSKDYNEIVVQNSSTIYKGQTANNQKQLMASNLPPEMRKYL